jgi:hypothetical protein
MCESLLPIRFKGHLENHLLTIFFSLFHPSNHSEFDPNECIQHTSDAILAMQFMAQTVVDAARYNTHKFPSFEEEENALMFNYSPLFTAKLFGSGFEQCYYF